MALKNNERNFVQCIRCKHGKFMQWLENPLIALCEVTKERQVAEAKRQCRLFVETTDEPIIQHFDSYDRINS